MFSSSSRRLGRPVTVLATAGIALLALPLTAASAAPGHLAATAVPAVALPAAVTSPPGGCAATYDLWATPGSMTLPGLATPVTILGYTLDGSATTAPGGPTLVACSGTPVTITLHNSLAESTALLFDGQPAIPDRVGAAPGGTKAYTLDVATPGTYLYEAGLTANAGHQAAMGLYGALVVRPALALGTAYGAADTAFDDEAVVVTSELDPALNNPTLPVTPATFDMRTFSPKYTLINGQPYPATTAIPTGAGRKVLLRYLNAGTQPHSMGVLGLNQTLVATDGSAYLDARHVVAETFGPGQTADAIATIPATAANGAKYALYDAAMNLSNNTTTGVGGALTFLSVGASTATTPTAVVNSITTTTGPVTITGFIATVTSTATLPATLTAVRYFVDSTSGTGTTVTPLPTSGTTFAVTLAAAITTPGVHTVYVQGSDDGITFGTFGQLSFTIPTTTVIDAQPPTTSSLALSPNPSNGTVAVSLSGLASDVGSGGSDIASAAYRLDGGAAVSIPVTKSGPGTANLLVSIPGPFTAAPHSVSVTSTDTAGNISSAVTVALVVDNTGPATSAIVATPNPSNGAIGYDLVTPAVRVTATITDAASSVAIAEGFIDTVGATGTGFLFNPTDGQFNGLTEAVYANVPLASVVGLSNGNHTIYVRGKDALGNWGATSPLVLVVDKLVPTISAATLSPTTVAFGAGGPTMSLTAADTGTGVVGGQYWFDGTTTPPAVTTAFTGASTALVTAALPGGSHTVRVRVKDAAGNWSAVSSATFTVVQAVNDAKSIISTSIASATQTSAYNSGAGVLANDLPGGAGRTVRITTAPGRTAGAGTGIITVTCQGGGGNTSATPAVGGNTVCTNGAFQVNLTAPAAANTNALRQAAKRGTYQFTYTMTLNGVTSAATVTITVT